MIIVFHILASEVSSLICYMFFYVYLDIFTWSTCSYIIYSRQEWQIAVLAHDCLLVLSWTLTQNDPAALNVTGIRVFLHRLQSVTGSCPNQQLFSMLS